MKLVDRVVIAFEPEYIGLVISVVQQFGADVDGRCLRFATSVVRIFEREGRHEERSGSLCYRKKI